MGGKAGGIGAVKGAANPSITASPSGGLFYHKADSPRHTHAGPISHALIPGFFPPVIVERHC
jgi:hypothetical protein